MNGHKSKKLIILEKLLRKMAVAVLKRHKPKVVAITGSVGKTTTKEAAWKLLSQYYKVRKNEKNYNNEIGVPLTIIGAKSGENSILRWANVFARWCLTMIGGRYPEILILEMGADRPGDIKYLCEFVPVDVAVLTNIGISHLEFFKTVKAVAREKGVLPKSLPVGGLAVLNTDNKEIRKLREQIRANIVTYGFNEKADMRATDMFYGYTSFVTRKGKKIQLVKGALFKLNYQGKIVPIKLSYGIGLPQIYAAMAAFAIGSYFKLNVVEASQKLENFFPPPGRMVLLKGIKNTAVIDDTYNSAPDSVTPALDTLGKIEANRKIVVLGDMLELGPEEEQSHRKVGREVASHQDIDFFITVGKRMVFAAQEYRKHTSKKDSLGHFNSPSEAGIFLQHMIDEGDVVLVKGSQGMRMEKIVEEIMAEPEKKEALLVRQDKTWKEKGYQMP